MLKGMVKGMRAMTEQHRSALFAIVGPKGTVDHCSNFNTDWTQRYKGHSTTVLRPDTAAQTAAILNYCNLHTISVGE